MCHKREVSPCWLMTPCPSRVHVLMENELDRSGHRHCAAYSTGSTLSLVTDTLLFSLGRHLHRLISWETFEEELKSSVLEREIRKECTVVLRLCHSNNPLKKSHKGVLLMSLQNWVQYSYIYLCLLSGCFKISNDFTNFHTVFLPRLLWHRGWIFCLPSNIFFFKQGRKVFFKESLQGMANLFKNSFADSFTPFQNWT